MESAQSVTRGIAVSDTGPPLGIDYLYDFGIARDFLILFVA